MNDIEKELIEGVQANTTAIAELIRTRFGDLAVIAGCGAPAPEYGKTSGVYLDMLTGVWYRKGENGWVSFDVPVATDPNKADLVDGMVPASQLPSYVDDVLEFDTRGSFPEPGETGKIYVAKDTNRTYRWSGSQYVGVGGGVQSVNGETDDITIDISGGTVFGGYDPPQYVPDGQTKVDVGILRISKGAASVVTNGEPEPVLISEVRLTGVFTTPTGASIKENPGSEKTLSQAVAENYAMANGADAKINAHMANAGNPHNVTAAQVGAYTKAEVNKALGDKFDSVMSEAAEEIANEGSRLNEAVKKVAGEGSKDSMTKIEDGVYEYSGTYVDGESTSY